MSDDNSPESNLRARILHLEQENQLFSDFAELSSDWFWEQNEEFRFVRFYGMSTEKLRRNQDLFIGKLRWEMPIEGITPQQLQEHIDTYQQHRSFRDFEYEVMGDNGQVQHYSISGTPFFDSNGEFRGYRGTGRNITDLHAAQKAVADSQQQLLQILQGNPIPTFVIDKSHCITHWNHACVSLTGIPEHQAIGSNKSWRGFYPSSRPTMADLVVESAPAEKVRQHYGNKFALSTLISGAYEAEDFFPSMGDDGYWLHFNASPLISSDGEIIGAIETLQNVTDRVRAELTEKERLRELQQAHLDLHATIEQLAEAKKLASLGRLIAGVAHELNTPLGNILLGLSSAQSSLSHLEDAFNGSTLSKTQLTEFLSESHSSIELINHNLTRSINLIHRFKELASDPEHNPAGSFRPYEVIQALLKISEKECMRKSITLTNDVPPGLTIYNYQSAFEQVIFSLIENSLTHGIKEGPGHILISVSEQENQLVFHFSDDGIGMSDESKKHAFDPFYTSHMGHGTAGLGLYRVYNLVTSVMGGSIHIKNHQSGVCVLITLPHQPLD